MLIELFSFSLRSLVSNIHFSKLRIVQPLKLLTEGKVISGNAGLCGK